MRFTSLIVAGVFALTATAQSSTATETSASATSTGTDPAQTSVQSAITKCLERCDAADVTCQAQCITVPAPSEQQANQTTECVAACPQGNGTEADINNYSQCVSGCISQYFYSTSGAVAQATATGTSDVTSVEPVLSTITTDGSTLTTTLGSRTVTNAPNSSGTGTTTGTGSAASSSETHNAADAIFAPAGPVGLFGLMAAILAL